MRTNNFVPDELQSFEYYRTKLPLYLRSSNAFLQHFKIWYDVLISDKRGLLHVEETILSLLNVFDARYHENFVEGETFDMLDKIASLYGLKRQFSVQYVNDELEDVTEELSLSNYEFLMFLRIQIIKNNFDGSREQLIELYKELNLEISLRSGTLDYDTVATCTVGFLMNESVLTKNIYALIKSKLFLIESAGIRYDVVTSTDWSKIVTWDADAQSDVGWTTSDNENVIEVLRGVWV